MVFSGGFCTRNCMFVIEGKHFCRHCFLCDPCLLNKVDNEIKLIHVKNAQSRYSNRTVTLMVHSAEIL